MTKKVIWNPPAELIKNSKLTKFIKYCSVKNYDELEIKSQSDPGWLWENVIKFSDIKFFKNYKKIIDEANGAPWTKWCVGGKTNIVLNLIRGLQVEKAVNNLEFSRRRISNEVLKILKDEL